MEYFKRLITYIPNILICSLVGYLVSNIGASLFTAIWISIAIFLSPHVIIASAGIDIFKEDATDGEVVRETKFNVSIVFKILIAAVALLILSNVVASIVAVIVGAMFDINIPISIIEVKNRLD